MTGEVRGVSGPIRHALVTVRQWFDSDYFPEGAQAVRERPDRFEFRRCLPFLFIHLGCIGLIWAGWSWTAVAVAAALYWVRMFAITAFYHRYFSHRTFSTSRWGQFAFAALGNTAVQRGALWWAAVHRHHHKHADTEHDVHSPGMKGFAWAHIGWMTSSRNFPTNYDVIRDLAKFPELVFLNRFDLVVPALYAAALYGVGELLRVAAPGLDTSGAQLVVWGFFVSTVVLLHGTLFINSMAHVFGGRRFHTRDDSRNNFLLAVITLGEGWHNNHHAFPTSARHGLEWWQLDLSWIVIRLFEMVGLAKQVRTVPNLRRESRRANAGAGERD